MRLGLLIVFVVTLGGLAFVFFAAAPETEAPIVDNSVANAVPDGWETHEERGLNFSYPPRATVGIENERVKVTYVGPDSQMNEITDGYTFFLDRRAINNDNARTVADAELEAQTQVLETLQSVSETEVVGRSGYQFTVESGLSTSTVYSIWEIDNSVIVTSQNIMDPNDEGYEDDVRAIKRSISVAYD